MGSEMCIRDRSTQLTDSSQNPSRPVFTRKMSTATNADSAVQSASIAARIGRWIGPLLAVFCYFSLSQIEDVPPEAPAAASVILLIGIWWMTEAIPLGATSLLPLVLFPLFGVHEASSKPIYPGQEVVVFVEGSEEIHLSSAIIISLSEDTAQVAHNAQGDVSDLSLIHI